MSVAELLAMTPRRHGAHEERLLDYHTDLPLVNTPTIQKVISTGRLLVQLNRHQIRTAVGSRTHHHPQIPRPPPPPARQRLAT